MITNNIYAEDFSSIADISIDLKVGTVTNFMQITPV